MATKHSELDKLVGTLRRERDELQVRLHLAKAEAKDQWSELEQKWQGIEAKLPSVKREVGSAAENIVAALKLAAEEVERGYANIRKLL